VVSGTRLGSMGLLGVAASIAPLLVGCTAEAASKPDAAPEATRLVLFVYDRSTSIPDHTLQLAQRLTNERVMALHHGDRVGGMQLLQLSLAEAPERWTQNVPERTVKDFDIARDSVLRIRFLRDATVLLGRLSDPKGREAINGTDILSTLHDVAEELRAYPDHEATLYLFSDMLQSNRQIDMENLRLMPPDDWVAKASGGGRLPDLNGLCVVVVGARVDTEPSQRVKAFWKEYFQATGATLRDQNYMLRPVRLPMNPCS